MAQALTISSNDVSKAKIELDRMRRSLRGWLKYRTLNDAVAAGTAPTNKPRAYARTVISQARDWGAEQKLAKQMHVLLAETYPDMQLPDPDVQKDPQAAVKLANIIVGGPNPALNAPTAQGAWYLSWPVLVVGGLLLAVTTVVKSYADVAKEKERLACIRAGACTDYGFWLKAGGIAALVWVAWNMGLGERVRKTMKG